MFRRKETDETESPGDEEMIDAGRVRVTDRRRININGEPQSASGGADDESAPESAYLKPKYVEELEARTREAEGKLADVLARFEQIRRQMQQETDETRQRLARAADERARGEKAAFISALLPVMDNLRRALEAAAQGGAIETLMNGLQSTIGGFERALATVGVESTVATGANFDPELHEAVDTVQVSPEKDGVVTAEYDRGYRLGDRLLRPARVQVGRGRSQESGQTAQGN
ncbi:MAG: nucleotide exchange factor GrpE [Pyrinomonadaceae bacterium]|nr:nucleotide exchange factor GrpE [Pyrinomonadaceae bacterium]